MRVTARSSDRNSAALATNNGSTRASGIVTHGDFGLDAIRHVESIPRHPRDHTPPLPLPVPPPPVLQPPPPTAPRFDNGQAEAMAPPAAEAVLRVDVSEVRLALESVPLLRGHGGLALVVDVPGDPSAASSNPLGVVRRRVDASTGLARLDTSLTYYPTRPPMNLALSRCLAADDDKESLLELVLFR